MWFFTTLMALGIILYILLLSVKSHKAGSTEIHSAVRNPLTVDEYMKEMAYMELNFVEMTKPFARRLAKNLEDAFSCEYQTNVYNRLLEETTFAPEKIMQLMFEQKRFLLMASIFRKVPMFSKDVDEVWHQLLMFTQDYKTFTESFAGQFIHHQPNVKGTDGEDDKFYFDMMYNSLFYISSFSEEAWGSKFYDQKPSPEFQTY